MPSLLVDIGANVARMQQDMNRAQNTVKGFANNASRSLRSLQTAFFALGGAYGIKSAVESLWDAGVGAEKMQLQLKAATGTVENAAGAYSYLTDESERLGLVFDNQVGGFVKIAAAAKNTALEGQGVRDIWLSVAEAGAALQLSAGEIDGALLAVSQMISKGKVSAEELRQQLGERLPGAFQVAAKAMGVSTAALDDMLKEGSVVADDFLPKFARALREQYRDAAVDASDSAQASLNRLHNEWNALSKDLGTLFLPAASAVVKKLREVTEGLSIALGITEQARLQKQRIQIIDELHIVEKNIADFKKNASGVEWMDNIFGSEEELHQRRQKLLADLEQISIEMNKPKGAGIQASAAPAGIADISEKERKKQMEQIADLAKQQWEAQYELLSVGNAAELEAWQSKEDEKLRIEEEAIEHREELRRISIDAALAEAEEEKRITAEVAAYQLRVFEKAEADKTAAKRTAVKNWIDAMQYFGQHSKAAFAAYKALATAEATIAGIESAIHAWKQGMKVGGPPMAAAFAAGSIAWTAAQIAAIGSQQQPSGDTGAIGTYSADAYTGTPTGAGEESRGSLEINIYGDILGDEGFIDSLVDKINSATETRNVRLNATNARYAEALA